MNDTLNNANRLRVKLLHMIETHKDPSDILQVALSCAGLYSDLAMYVDANHVLCSAVSKHLDWDEKLILKNAISDTVNRYEEMLMFQDGGLTLKHMTQNRDITNQIMRSDDDVDTLRD